MNEEKFSLVKFFAGFGKPYKIIFIIFVIMIFNFVSDKFEGVKKHLNVGNITNYQEAPNRPRIDCYGLRIGKLGLCVIYEN